MNPLLKLGQYRFYDTLEIVADIGIRETNDVKSIGFQTAGSISVISDFFFGRVGGPVHFNDEFCIQTDEIDDKSINRMLAPELPVRQLSVSQSLPKQGLSSRFPTTKMPRPLHEPLHLRLP